MFFESHLHINTSRFFLDGGGSVRYCFYIAKKMSKAIIEIFCYEKNISMETQMHKKKYICIFLEKNNYSYFVACFFQLREEGIERIGEAIGRSSEQVSQDACFFGS